MDRQTDGRTNGRTDGWMDRWDSQTDTQTCRWKVFSLTEAKYYFQETYSLFNPNIRVGLNYQQNLRNKFKSN